MEVIVSLANIDIVWDFVDYCNKFDEDIDIRSRHFVLDAKSILGVLSLDLSTPKKVNLHSNDKEVCEKFAKCMMKYGV